MADAGEVYERIRAAFVQVVEACSPEQLACPVPATPDWSVRDVLAHVVGLAAALNGQHFPDPADEGGVAWNATLVATRADRSVTELVAEWDREGPVFAEGLRIFGAEMGAHFVADLLTHLADVRQALGLGADPHDDEAVAVSLDHYLGYLHEQLAGARWGVLEIRTSSTASRRVGAPDGPVRAVLTATPFDVLRTFSARRSVAQVRSLRWKGDVDGLVGFLEAAFSGGYAIPEHDLPD